MAVTWSLWVAVAVLVACAPVLVLAGSALTTTADRLADRTGLGEAVTGALLLGATTSLAGIVTTATGAVAGDAGFAASNALGGIAVQTAFLPVADLLYRRANLEHAAASVGNMLNAVVLIALLGVVLVAMAGPDVSVAGVHPLSGVVVGAYLFSVHLARSTHDRPMWRATETEETRADEPDDTPPGERLSALWSRFAVLALGVAATGYVLARAGVSLAEGSPLSGTFVGSMFTGVISSLPELVILVAAVRSGALTMGVGNIIGGNTFDVLFLPVADLAFRGGSVYHEAGDGARFLAAMTVLLTAVIAAGLVQRERKGIGFEGVTVIVVYLAGMLTVALAF